MQAVEIAALVVVASAVVSTTTFVVIYATRPWYKDPVGRSVMSFSFSLMILSWTVQVFRFTEFPFEDWIRIGMYGMVSVAVVYQTVVLVQSIKKQNRSERKH